MVEVPWTVTPPAPEIDHDAVPAFITGISVRPVGNATLEFAGTVSVLPLTDVSSRIACDSCVLVRVKSSVTANCFRVKSA